MKSTHSHTHNGGTRNLRFEPLEQRSLLAVAAFTVNLYEDVGGTPGQLISDDTVEVGATFFVEIMARELHPVRTGLRGVSLDIAWDPEILAEVDAPFDPHTLITPDLPLFIGGTLDGDAGTIVGLTGYASVAGRVGRPIGNLMPERFALLRFQAIQPVVDAPFSMQEGFLGIGTVPVSNLSSADIYFEPQTITIVEPVESVETSSGTMIEAVTLCQQGESTSVATESTIGCNAMEICVGDATDDTPVVAYTSPVVTSTQEVHENVPLVGESSVEVVGNGQMIQMVPQVVNDSTLDQITVPQFDDPLLPETLPPPPQAETVTESALPTAETNGEPVVDVQPLSAIEAPLLSEETAPIAAVTIRSESVADADAAKAATDDTQSVVALVDCGEPRREDSDDLSADLNGDGTVDLGDFGLLNVGYRILSKPVEPAPLLAACASTESQDAAATFTASAGTILPEPSVAIDGDLSRSDSTAATDAVFTEEAWRTPTVNAAHQKLQKQITAAASYWFNQRHQIAKDASRTARRSIAAADLVAMGIV